jgi:hypothetical protein
VGHPRGSLLLLWEGEVVSMRDIYFERNISARQNKNFGRHFVWLKYFTYHLVPVLAPNYTQYVIR